MHDIVAAINDVDFQRDNQQPKVQPTAGDLDWGDYIPE
jgi:hypothetical protein